MVHLSVNSNSCPEQAFQTLSSFSLPAFAGRTNFHEAIIYDYKLSLPT